MNLKQTIRKILKEEIDRKNIFYGFVGLPNYWVSDFDRLHTDKYFEGKEYEDFYFDNFKDMDEMIGHPESLFGTRGLPVGHPKRTSRSFNDVYKQYGTAIVRVVKKEMTNESAYVRRRLSMDRLDEELEDSLNNATEMLSIFIKKGQKITLDKFKNIVVNVMMDSLHGELSDWGTEEFPYGEVFDFIKDRYQGIIKRKYDKLFPNRTEMTESELTEKCWPGYTQKGMKTMFGKRYPNCVKKKKK